MAEPLSPETIALIKATVPALEAHGLDITREMYARLLQNPAIKSLFNQSHQGDGAQPRALAMAVLAYAKNIDNLGMLAGAAVERIAQKHVGLNILAEHYPYVGEALIGAIRAVLGDAATPEIIDAWGKAYWFLADLLIGREKQIYDAHEQAPGGWTGWRDFTIARRIDESDTITSFELAPSDGKEVLRHRPGQYLSFAFDLADKGSFRRNYSISSAPSQESYRISVKRADQGKISNWLHDEGKIGVTLKVSAPAGEFALPASETCPLVLLSGGVGLTPMISMLEDLAQTDSQVPVRFIHATHSGATHAFGARVRALSDASKGRIRPTIFYSAPRLEDEIGVAYDKAGHVTAAWLRAEMPEDADYYVCGPHEFQRDLISGLRASGVADARIHYEFFGPTDEFLTS
ncbi:NO-inducible flavohemoprotein [Beijerinckia indica]|uniref:Flavohemoprotein n=1 Tax=Beijerinckia indica subsp. indica (strain ATCC 9039 / DSM 1715 / NCIMB 8712) TaxID=395963 RepID=B2IF30_BEII9|nr:NO-inducible flavohemoprotein [Beijerinckia indica]ACB95595.1 Oxidoreductase FAD-binding domain protein [Beijerinckia indica subsp. indica ATCC 9039]